MTSGSIPSDRVSDTADRRSVAQVQMATLRAALIAGEQSGDAEPFDLDEFIAARSR